MALMKLSFCAFLASASTLVKRTLPDDVAAQRAAFALDGSAYAYFAPENLSAVDWVCLLYTSPSPRDGLLSRMPSSA